MSSLNDWCKCGKLLALCQVCAADSSLSQPVLISDVSPVPLAASPRLATTDREPAKKLDAPTLTIDCAEVPVRVGGGHALHLRISGLNIAAKSSVTLIAVMQFAGQEAELGRLNFSDDDAQETLPFIVKNSGIQYFKFRIELPKTVLETTFSDLVILDNRDSLGDHKQYLAAPEVNLHVENQAIVDVGTLPSHIARLNVFAANQAIVSGLLDSVRADAPVGGALRSWVKTFRERPRIEEPKHPYAATQACLRTESGVRHIRLLAGSRWWLGRHGYVPRINEHPVDIHLRADEVQDAPAQTNRISGNHILFEHTKGVFEVSCFGSNGNLLDGQSVSVIGKGPHRVRRGMRIRVDARRHVAELNVACVTDTMLVIARADKLATHECWVLVAEGQVPATSSKEQRARLRNDTIALGALGLPPLAHFGGGFWELQMSDDSAGTELLASRNIPIGPTEIPSTVRGTWLPAAHPEVM